MDAKCNGVKALMTSRPNLSILGLIIPLRIHLGRRMNAKCNGVKALMTSRPNFEHSGTDERKWLLEIPVVAGRWAWLTCMDGAIGRETIWLMDPL